MGNIEAISNGMEIYHVLHIHHVTIVVPIPNHIGKYAMLYRRTSNIIRTNSQI